MIDFNIFSFEIWSDDIVDIIASQQRLLIIAHSQILWVCQTSDQTSSDPEGCVSWQLATPED